MKKISFKVFHIEILILKDFKLSEKLSLKYQWSKILFVCFEERDICEFSLRCWIELMSYLTWIFVILKIIMNYYCSAKNENLKNYKSVERKVKDTKDYVRGLLPFITKQLKQMISINFDKLDSDFFIVFRPFLSLLYSSFFFELFLCMFDW